MKLCCAVLQPNGLEANKYAESKRDIGRQAVESLAVSLLAIAGHVVFQAVESAVGPSVLFPLKKTISSNNIPFLKLSALKEK